ncbi:bacterio-opsin activator domain-containing protein [Haloferax sp. YSMS24]|uniref:bacterio-opsin activator domain-containing protein n=1 Tax=Haloferax sp. YSMS24 TaxID=3388425 RepID=UPI00398D6438
MSSGTDTVVSVLLAGADDSSLDSLAAGFEERGVETTTVTSRSAGFELLDARAADAVVCTDVFDGGSGLGFVRAVATRYPHLPTAWVTDDPFEQAARKSMEAGIDECFPRTDSPSEYALLCNRLVSLARETAETRGEREYEQIFNKVNDAIAVFDPETLEIVAVNETYTDVFGYDPETIRERGVDGLSVTEAGYTESRAREIIQRVAETGDAESVEWLVETADGEHRWFEVNTTPATINGQERVLGISRDITRRKAREEDLHQSERQFRQIASAVNEVIHLTSVDFSETYYLSPAAEGIWGQSVEAMSADPLAFTEMIHPDDRSGFVSFLDEVTATLSAPTANTDDEYEYEYRVRRDDGEVRWVDGRLYPIRDDAGAVSRLVTVSRDVTDQHRREQTLESLHDATRRLTEADSLTAVAETAVEAATTVLAFPAVRVFLYDEDTGALELAAAKSRFEVPLSDHARVVPGDNPIWSVFVENEPTRSTGSTDCVGFPSADDIESELRLPLSGRGVLVVGHTAPEFQTDDIEVAQILAARLEAGLNHVAGEREIERREEELERETTRAERLRRLNSMVRDIEQTLVRESSRSSVERAVCERLVVGGDYSLAWVGEPTVSGDSITLRSRATADGAGTVDTAVSDRTLETHPAWKAIQTGASHVVQNIVTAPARGQWRQQALREGFQSCCAIPLVHDERVHGVLVVYADEPSAFTDRERQVLAELGRSIGHTITTIERRRALESDHSTELEFAVEDERLYFVALASEAERTVEYERMIRRPNGSVSTYYTVDADDNPVGADESVLSLSDEHSAFDVVHDGDDSCVVEVRTDDWFGSLFADFGAVVTSASADASGGRLVVELPRGVSPRAVAERFQSSYPETELVAKRETHRPIQTVDQLEELVGDQLTDRQFEVLKTAYSAGYFEWPRHSEGQEVAAMLDITQPTFNRHLRLAEQTTFGLLFDET